MEAAATLVKEMGLTAPFIDSLLSTLKRYRIDDEELWREIQTTSSLKQKLNDSSSSGQHQGTWTNLPSSTICYEPLRSATRSYVVDGSSAMIPDERELESTLKSRLQNIEETYRGNLTANELENCVQELQEGFFNFNYESSKVLEAARIANITNDEFCRVIRQKLAPVEDAGFDAGRGRSRCFRGTRRIILKDLQNWVSDTPNSSPESGFWLCGDDGIGKTTIAQTVAERSFVDGTLGASFFCSFTSRLKSDVKKIIPTIVYQLACSTKATSQFRATLLETLYDPDYTDVSKQDVSKQFQDLIVQPIRQSNLQAVVILDGLEECKDRHAALSLFSLLAKHNNSSLQFLVTIPPLATFYHTAHNVPKVSFENSDWRYHTLKGDDSDRSDIELFLAQAGKSQERSAGHTSPERRKDKPNIVFLVANIAQQLVSQNDYSANSELPKILDGRSSLDIDTLYRRIIDHNLTKGDKSFSKRLLSALGLLTVSQEVQGLSLITLVELLEGQLSDDQKLDSIATYRHVLTPLCCVLDLPKENDRPIVFRHKSFLDFLVDPSRGTSTSDHNSSPYVDADKLHSIAAWNCLKHMNMKLEKNICSKLRYAPNHAQPNDKSINETTKYCCRYWGRHLDELDLGSLTEYTENIKNELTHFLSARQLHWMEVLALLGELDHGTDSLDRAQVWLMYNLDAQSYSNLLPHINEGRRFVADALDAATESALHIYHSILPFVPQSAVMRLQRSKEKTTESDKEVTVLVGREAWRGSEGATFSIQAQDWVRDLSFSPVNSRNNRDIAVTLAVSGDGFCNLYTNLEQAEVNGENPKELDPEPESYRVFRSTTFSSDNVLFATASHRKITVWKIADIGKPQAYCQWPPKGNKHSDTITSVMFHPFHPRLLLIRCSSKKTPLALWSIQENSPAVTRSIELGDHVGPVCWFNRPVPIPDRICILTADDESNTIAIWQVDHSRDNAKAEKERTFTLPSKQSAKPEADTAKGSESNTTSTRPSLPEEAKVTGSDQRITSIASSADGSLVAWGSEGGDLVAFDSTDGKMLLCVRVGQGGSASESEEITSLQFSPCSHANLLACASGDTVYLYYIDPLDPSFLEPISKFSGHSDVINTIAFSPNGEMLASGGDDNMINFWNISYHHHRQITCVSTSDDGRLILSGSEDKTVRVWDKQSGRLLQVLRGAESSIQDTIFFRDSERRAYIFAVGSDGKTALWIAQETREPGSEMLFDIMHQDTEQKAIGFSFRAEKKSRDCWYCTLSRYALSAEPAGKSASEPATESATESPSESSASHAGFFCWLDDYWGSTTRIECWTLRGRQMVLAAAGVLPADYDECVQKMGHKAPPATSSASKDITVVAKCFSNRCFSATWENARDSLAFLGSSPASLQFTLEENGVSQCNWQEHDLTWSNESMDQKWVIGEGNRKILWVPQAFRGFGFWDGKTLIQGGTEGKLAVVDFQGVDATSTDKVLK